MVSEEDNPESSWHHRLEPIRHEHDMRPIPIPELAWLLGGRFDAAADGVVTGFATDSREVRPGDAFLAIKGENVDGHDFVEQALAHGAAVIVCEKPIEGPSIQLSSLVAGLARLGRTLRGRFSGPVIGVTGSAGKTTTKEFLAATLTPLGPVLKSEGNRNTEYTSPLVWTGLGPEHRAVVVEMAMRGFDQIRHLGEFTKPNIGLITNIGFSHLEMVGSREGVAKAKGELLEELPDNGVAILWNEDDYISQLRRRADRRQVLTFGFEAGADCRVTAYRQVGWNSAEIEGSLDGVTWQAKVPAVGRHIAMNAAAAVLAAAVAGANLNEAAAQIEKSVIPPLRMEIREFNGATLILDAYNASPPAMLAAIEVLASSEAQHRYAVVGDMRELGEYTAEAHRQVGRLIGRSRLDSVLFYGEWMQGIARPEAIDAGLTPEQALLADDIADVQRFLKRAERGDVLLVKGSRALELERALN